MYEENPLVTLRSDTVKAIIAQTLEACRIDEDMFESTISQLIAEAEPDITESVTDDILQRYRLKIACDLTVSLNESFLAATSRTCRSFSPLKKLLFRIRRCNSVFELNILDLSSLDVLEQDEDRLTELLEAFTEPVVVPHRIPSRGPRTIKFPEYVRGGRTPLWGCSAALHGQLLDLDREYPPSPFAE